jgi:predicted Zn-dependent peptidase
MLEEGAGARSSLEIADALDFLGASLSTAASFDASSVRLHVPVARLADALPVMADIVMRPTFPEDELKRLRQERLTDLLQARDDPAAIAASAFPRILYGPTHRYGTDAIGTAATLRGFTPQDLRDFYREYYRPDNSALLMVGDVTPDGVIRLLERALGEWKPAGPGATNTPLPVAQEPVSRQIYIIDKPQAAQSQIRIGWIGAARSTPDYFPLLVMNTVLGGSFSSRLNLNLREQHGYAYGAGSIFEMRAAAGPFRASAGVQTDKTADAVREFFNELNGILKPVPPDELARAKSYVALHYPAQFETTGDISRRLEEMIVYKLPTDYFSTYVSNIQAVTSADVHRVATKYIQPDKFAVVIVGDRKAIEADVKALNLGPVKTLSIDDVLGPAPE